MKMKNSIVLKIILALCGLAFLVAGGVALFNPEGFTLRNGIDITGNLGLYNDYRGMGGLLLGGGILIILGVIHARMRFTSTVVAAVLYSVFTLGRLLSIIQDGTPVDGLVKATIVEGILAVLAVFALVMFRDKSAS